VPLAGSDVKDPAGRADDAQAEPAFRPYVPDDQAPAELTARAVVLGVAFGVVFGARTVYLALKAGLTVSASIPIAVLAISVFKRLGSSTILENNIVQTIGSAGESIAPGSCSRSAASVVSRGAYAERASQPW